MTISDDRPRHKGELASVLAPYLSNTLEGFIPGDPAPKWGDKAKSWSSAGTVWRDTMVRALERLATARAGVFQSAALFSDAEWAELGIARAERNALRATPWTAPVDVQAVFFLRSPQRLRNREPWLRPDQPPDADKLMRGFMDALAGPVYVDDRLVVNESARRFYATERQPPGMVFRVAKLDHTNPDQGLPWWAAVPMRNEYIDLMPELGAWA